MSVQENLQAFEAKLQAAQARMDKARAELAAILAAHKNSKGGK